ncbi:PDZ domain-containing protein [Sporomusa aerivorans]|uniref:PDZ domain-containing protein n=1 Tax=Sporomusa aerivorans TaxID=204936 RepID=UPI00352AA678
MKKTIFLLLMLMFFTSPGFATNPPGHTDILQIVSDYQNLNTSFYTDPDYYQFQKEHSRINEKVKAYQEATPKSFTTDLNAVYIIYNDINALWKAKIDNLLIVVPTQTSLELKEKYPDIESIVNKSIMGGWNPDSTILALNYLAKKNIDKLATQVEILKPTYGFKYADGLIGNSIFVSIVDPKGNAYQAGLRFGDRITQVNGMPVKDADTFTSMLAGPEGSRLTFHVKTDDTPVRVIEVVKTVLVQ